MSENKKATHWSCIERANAVLALIVALLAIGGTIVSIAHFVGGSGLIGGGNSSTSHGATPPVATATPTPSPTATSSIAGLQSETTGGETHTWTNFNNAGGVEGPTIAANQTVQVSCKVTGFKVADGNTWWYRIASSPWNNTFYASADAFYNNGQISGSLGNTPWVDGNVPNC